MDKMEWIAPCHFGLEAVLKRELQELDCEIVSVEDGRVTFAGGIDTAARANIFLRTAERILLKVGSFYAETFDELFERTREIPWEDYIPEDGKFWVAKAASVKSRLFSPSDIQSIMKKAMVERLKSKYHIGWFPENGAPYPVRVFLMKDTVTVGIDTTGTSLHKRGYRPAAGKAPIAENLAGCPDHAYTLARRPDPCGSILRERDIPDRSGNDGCPYRTWYEPFVYGGRVDEPFSLKSAGMTRSMRRMT